MFSNKRKIFVSKLLFVIIWFTIINFIWTIAVTILYTRKFANITQGFLFFSGFLVSNFLVLLLSFIFLVFIISFFKKVSTRNTIYLLATMAAISAPLLLRTYVYKVRSDINTKNYLKIVEKSKNKLANELAYHNKKFINNSDYL
ncbi:hypothetical protein [Mycoplasma phocoeninasale]|uniref:Uncharacterized protein n=1 Tax=Mycoplasma phocoeninasale TaxID=2726117 RepID=A0A858U1Z5_9MOLU|nr:hypothetical protein [Mycoplasma phocoeninasale]MBN0970445.1 hypothetical protein [Mycoplasma phocoeninasale]QJG66432.1 hypothetical protein HGG64_01770 [Mycoplasma phocoeninasale]